MSRHRMVRNLTEDDYYDDYDDDYYDDDDYYEDSGDYGVQQQYAPPSTSKKKTTATASTQTTTKPSQKATAATTTARIAVAGKVATTASVGVTKPPPGWGKPTPSGTTATNGVGGGGISKPPPNWGKPTTSGPKSGGGGATGGAGVTKPPPGWGKPSTPNKKGGGGGGISKPPPGWGKPSSSGAATTASVAAPSKGGVSKPPPGWDKPTTSAAVKKNNNNSPSTPPRNTGTAATATATNTSTANQKSQSYTPNPLPDALKKKNIRSQLSMVVLGHVDAGKSTLMGQLLVQVGQVSKREARKQENLSWLLDENESERQRGVTMEIATKGFTVPDHDIVVLDAPGHADFIPIMITGAAHADVAILVIAAVTGEFEAGFDRGGQTKEHVQLARGLGVTQVIVAINKLDVESWSQTRYKEIQMKIKEYLLQQQFGPKRIRFIPLSGLTGENVKSRSVDNTALTSWYKGPTLLEAINGFQKANRQIESPLRFIITDLYAEGKGVTARGRVVQGYLQVGDRLVVLPVGDVTTVSKLEHVQPPSSITTDDGNDDEKFFKERLSIGIAGDTIELVLQGIDIMRMSIGNILSYPNIGTRPKIVNRARAKIMVMDPLHIPIIRGAQVLFHMHSLDVPAVLNKLLATTKRDGSIKKERPRALTAGTNAIIELTLSDKIVLERFIDCRSLGRFVLRRSGETIAMGIIDELL